MAITKPAAVIALITMPVVNTISRVKTTFTSIKSNAMEALKFTITFFFYLFLFVLIVIFLRQLFARLLEED